MYHLIIEIIGLDSQENNLLLCGHHSDDPNIFLIHIWPLSMVSVSQPPQTLVTSGVIRVTEASFVAIFSFLSSVPSVCKGEMGVWLFITSPFQPQLSMR